jgi:dihydrofolate synthase/folylpolyglutamate synthase
MFRTYLDAVRYLNAATDYERMAHRYSSRTYNLGRMGRLLRALGHPERQFRSLHIAGTKGKGSTAHMAEAILRAAGYRTGLYTSPHLVRMLERIRLDGRRVSERDFVRTLSRMEGALRRLRPTYFEIMTAAAFLLFAQKRVDYAVVEVGLGGRLDATNLISPVACALTTIDYDHMDKLGRTLSAIAREKAGIIKPGIPVVSSAQRPSALAQIRRFARPFFPGISISGASGPVLKFKVTGVRGRVYRCLLPVLGRHQATNAATAIALVEASGARVDPGIVRRALRTVRLPARIERIRERPEVIVDAAHNPVSARALGETLGLLPRRGRRILIFGASSDKDYPAMMRALLPLADVKILTRSRSPRAADPREMTRHATGWVLVARTVGEAVELGQALARPQDTLLVTGSFYVAGEALEALGEES